MKDEHIPLVIFGSFAGLIGLGFLVSRPMVTAQVRLANALAEGIEQGRITHVYSPMGMMGGGMSMQKRANPRKKKSEYRKNPAITPTLF